MLFRILTLLFVMVGTSVSAIAVDADTAPEDVIHLDNVGRTRNVSRFNEEVYFGGQPARADFALFAERGVKTIINLRTAEEMSDLEFDEKSEVERHGMKYIHIPMMRKLPKDEQLKVVMDALDIAPTSKVLLHCASSWSRRCGRILLATRIDPRN